MGMCLILEEEFGKQKCDIESKINLMIEVRVWLVKIIITPPGGRRNSLRDEHGKLVKCEVNFDRRVWESIVTEKVPEWTHAWGWGNL